MALNYATRVGILIGEPQPNRSYFYGYGTTEGEIHYCSSSVSPQAESVKIKLD